MGAVPHAPSRGSRRLRNLLRWYYGATPVFWLTDTAFHLPLRAAFLDSMPVGRHVYYALCTLIGVAVLRRPELTVSLARLESVANIVFIILSVMVWYFGMMDQVAGDSAVVAVPGPWHLANFVLAAGAAGTSYFLQAAKDRGSAWPA